VQVANVGEQRPNADAKVFEVKIEVLRADTTLRPGMTTANAILTSTVKNVLYVPLEAVATEGDMTFVYKRDGRRILRQQIVTGAMNDDQIIVVHGLKEDDEVLLTPPADNASLSLTRLPESLVPRKDTTAAGKKQVDKAKAESTPTAAKAQR
jgi:hypothetical protein